MTHCSRLCGLGLATLSLMACGPPGPSPSPRAPAPEAPRDRLGHTVERYWDESASLRPWYSWGGSEVRYAQAPADVISPQALADALALERRYLKDLQDVSRGGLDADSKLTYDMFRAERQLAIESFTYPAELLPVNPYDATPQQFALMALAAERNAVSNVKDFDRWAAAADAYVGWTAQAIANMREGLRRGYVLPRILVEKSLPVLAALGEDGPSNIFYRSLSSSPAATGVARLPTSEAPVAAVVKNTILPAYRTLHDFLQHEYLPRSRDNLGLWALPLGNAWYAYLVKRATGGSQTMAELRAQAAVEVARLQGRVHALLAETGFGGNAQGYLDQVRGDPRFSFSKPAELLNAYEQLKARVAADLSPTVGRAPEATDVTPESPKPVATPAAQSVLPPPPKADFEIGSVEGFRQATAPAVSYRRAMAYGKTRAVLYVNTSRLDSQAATGITAQFLREAVPGRHYQLSLQQERADLPKFRRFGGAPAFVEGWALYATSLGEETALYGDAEAKLGALLAQLQCAVGAVIDIGIHAEKWSRQEAIDYLHAQMPVDDQSAANEVDRDLALPGSNLACNAGFLRIQGLRARAQQTLGARFELRAFHAELLRNGAVPLDLLEANMKSWVEVAAKSDQP